MVDREHIFNFLRLNGIPPTAEEQSIAKALRFARWHDDDIQRALSALRGDGHAQMYEPERDTHNIFFSDTSIAPETLNSLLGVDVSVPKAQQQAREAHRARGGNLTILIAFAVILISIALGVFITLLIMYLYGVGPFYAPVENYSF